MSEARSLRSHFVAVISGVVWVVLLGKLFNIKRQENYLFLIFRYSPTSTKRQFVFSLSEPITGEAETRKRQEAEQAALIGKSRGVYFRACPRAIVSSVKEPAGFPDEIFQYPRTTRMRMETPTGFPTFSALHFLRNYNQFLLPSVADTNLAYSYSCSSAGDALPEDQPRSPAFSLSPLLGPFTPYPHYTLSSDLKANKYQDFLSAANAYGRRPRGEKKPIPDDQKDDRYYERRKRNNQAAKKSRDARKLREDQIALRATLLEHENAVLRAQLSTLREETESLRQLMLSQKKNPTAVAKTESSGDAADGRRTWQYGKDLNKF